MFSEVRTHCGQFSHLTCVLICPVSLLLKVVVYVLQKAHQILTRKKCAQRTSGRGQYFSKVTPSLPTLCEPIRAPSTADESFPRIPFLILVLVGGWNETCFHQYNHWENRTAATCCFFAESSVNGHLKALTSFSVRNFSTLISRPMFPCDISSLRYLKWKDFNFLQLKIFFPSHWTCKSFWSTKTENLTCLLFQASAVFVKFVSY